jgi:8-oxo-dGTP diphosphatase/2-hydroxy-dATP diphosphatase
MNKTEKKVMTEVLAVNDSEVLLGRRKKNGFGSGKWLGFGGKLESGESIEEAMTRECQEEANISITKYEKRGILTFHYIDDPDMEVHYFEALEYEGEPTESNEMEIGWFEIDKIPYDNMWPNDRYWLPKFLERKWFSGDFWFDKNYKIIKNTFR